MSTKFEPRPGFTVQAYQFALDPTEQQAEQLRSHCGAARFVYNWGRELVRANRAQRQAEYSYGLRGDDLTPRVESAFALRKAWNAAKHDVAPWWADNNKEAYSSGLANLAAACKNYRESWNGTRKGSPVGFPRRKSKRRSTWSYTVTTGAFGLGADRRHVKLPSIGQVRTHESTRTLARRVQVDTARVLSCTVSWRRGRWHVSLRCEVQRNDPPAASTTPVGVDLGAKHLAVLSTGEYVDTPANLDRKQRELRQAQRRLSRRTGPDKRTGQQPSNRWIKARQQVSQLHTQVSNARADGLHQLTTRLVHEHGVLVLEDLNVSGMTRSAKGTAEQPGTNVTAKAGLNRRVLNAAPGELRRQITYKSGWSGGVLHVADRWYPSSKTCSACGVVKAKLRLSQRTFCCDSCGLSIDRDLNAAYNLAALAAKYGGTVAQSCGATAGTSSPTDGNPRKTTPGGGGGYRHGKAAPSVVKAA